MDPLDSLDRHARSIIRAIEHAIAQLGILSQHVQGSDLRLVSVFGLSEYLRVETHPPSNPLQLQKKIVAMNFDSKLGHGLSLHHAAGPGCAVRDRRSRNSSPIANAEAINEPTSAPKAISPRHR